MQGNPLMDCSNTQKSMLQTQKNYANQLKEATDEIRPNLRSSQTIDKASDNLSCISKQPPSLQPEVDGSASHKSREKKENTEEMSNKLQTIQTGKAYLEKKIQEYEERLSQMKIKKGKTQRGSQALGTSQPTQAHTSRGAPGMRN